MFRIYQVCPVNDVTKPFGRNSSTRKNTYPMEEASALQHTFRHQLNQRAMGILSSFIVRIISASPIRVDVGFSSKSSDAARSLRIYSRVYRLSHCGICNRK